jgi:hypothetical protein
VILFSGRHDVDHLAPASGFPVVKVLTKPIKEAELRAAVESVAAAAGTASAGTGAG